MNEKIDHEAELDTAIRGALRSLTESYPATHARNRIEGDLEYALKQSEYLTVRRPRRGRLPELVNPEPTGSESPILVEERSIKPTVQPALTGPLTGPTGVGHGKPVDYGSNFGAPMPQAHSSPAVDGEQVLFGEAK